MRHRRRVFVTGMGVVTPLGIGVEATWRALLAGRCGIRAITRFPADGFPCRIAGEVPDEALAPVVAHWSPKRFDRYSILALVAAREAWEQSGLELDAAASRRAGVVVGTAHGGVETWIDETLRMGDRGPARVSPFSMPKVLPNMAAGQISIEYGLRGICLSPTSACASGNHAIGEAARMIADGRLDVCLAGASDAPVVPLVLAGYASARALSTRNDDPARASRPFDAGRDGFVPAEGAGVLVLEADESVRRRRARALGEVKGYGASADAFHITSPAEGGEGAVRAMEDALADAGLDPRDVDYVSAHGTSTPGGDRTESIAVRALFGRDAPPASSVKGAMGHLLGAAGAVEAAICLRSIAEGVAPPTINLEVQGPDCDLDYVAGEARPMKIDRVLSNAFGFGGTNASLVLVRA